MEVDLDCPQGSLQKINFRDSINFFLKFGKNMEMAITGSFFELQAPDFAWK